MKTQHIFDIQDFGALPDGSTLNTTAIQKTIDTCHEHGGGVVYCGPGRYLTGSLLLKSNVEFHLSMGCTIIGSSHLSDYQQFSAPGFRNEFVGEATTQYIFGAVDAENIAITGPGEINGSGPCFYDTSNSTLWGRFYHKPKLPRPRMVMFYQCHNIRLEGTGFIDSPCWTIWLMKCNQVFVNQVRIIGDQHMINNDGIDVDGCRNVTISNSIFQTGDDCIAVYADKRVFEEPSECENIVVSNCTLDSWCQGIRIGIPGHAPIHHCSFSNLTIRSTNNGILFEYPLCYLPKGDQGTTDVHDIVFSNIVLECVYKPIQISVEDPIELTRLSNLSFSDLRIRSGEPCIVSGNPHTIIRDIKFNNIAIETSGNDAVICRYCDRVSFNHVELSNRSQAQD